MKKETLFAHIYAGLAISRTAHFWWRFERRIDPRKRRNARKYHREPGRWLHKQDIKTVNIKSRDGLRLTGHFLEHPEAERIILMFHGWRGRWDIDGAPLAEALYGIKSSILMVDQRAHGTSGGKHIGFGVLERYDCLKWLEYLMANTKDIPVYLGGVSMGASTVLMASGMELPERVSGVIADCGFTIPYEMIIIFAKKYIKAEINDVADKVNFLCRKRAGYDLKEYTSLEAMKSCTVPVFFAHGAKDTVVPWEMTVQNYEACTSDKRLFIAKEAGHTESYSSDPKRYMEELADFFHWRIT